MSNSVFTEGYDVMVSEGIVVSHVNAATSDQLIDSVKTCDVRFGSSSEEL